MNPRATCEGCNAATGERHQQQCRFELCMVHGWPLRSCPGDIHVCDSAGDSWTGWPPGHRECFDLGWYIRWDAEAKGWIRCRPGVSAAGPDLDRLYSEGEWDRNRRRWVRNPGTLLSADEVYAFLERRRADATDPPPDSGQPVFFGPDADSGEPGQLIISAQTAAEPDWWATGVDDGKVLQSVFAGAAPYLLLSLLVPSGESAIGFRVEGDGPSAGCRFPATVDGDRQAATAYVHIAHALFGDAAPVVRGACGHWWPQAGDDFGALRNDCPDCGRPPGYRVGATVGIQPEPPEDGELR